jgi:hypothetical protein
MRHPAEFYIKFLLISDPQRTNEQVMADLLEWSFLAPDPLYLPSLRSRIAAPPANYQPTNRLHRATSQYLRDQGVYEAFFPNDAFNDALELLSSPEKRLLVEQILLSRVDLKQAAIRVNQARNLMLTEEALLAYRHYFWNVDLLTFDDWGRYLYGRSSLYEKYMALLQAPLKLAYHHLRIEQSIESKNMIRDIMELAYFTAMEVGQRPGTGMEKVKAIALMGKLVNECHQSLSTSDMALKDVLGQFENFRMAHPQALPPSIQDLTPNSSFTGSGANLKAIPGGKEGDQA